MTPEQFLDRLKRGGLEPAYLFLGAEAYNRERARRALIEAALAPEERETGFTRHDLDQVSLAAAVDDARSLSLFAARRVIWLARAEAAVPKGKSGDGDEEASSGSLPLEEYLRDPAPGTVLVIETARYDFEGEDKAKLERVRQFFSVVPAQVEFRRFTPEAARALAQNLARAMEVKLGLAELALLLEATGHEASRIAAEMEKLSLFANGRKIEAEDIAALVPDAQSTTIFALVAALGRGDRAKALESLDTLTRAGEYMPLALAFLATQFRMALAAREAGMRGASEIQARFERTGTRIWPQRARQISETIQAFPQARLEGALAKVFEADRALRDAHPDDRIVMENMIFELCPPAGR
ncbi:MAG TPA: DNA polymerase III subunit delta [Bryobacteraceae bacterium]